jgi:hypothetical protein
LLKVWSEKQFTQSEKVVEKAKKLAVTSKWWWVFGESDIVLWKSYDGLVKLKYNYGIFVTVKGVEWLLHKSQIVVPEGIDSRKWIYQIWDPITVKAIEWKEVKWEKKIVWGM